MPLFAGFGITLVFLIVFLSDMHLSHFLCAFLMNVIFQASGAVKSYPIGTLDLQNLSIFMEK